MYDITKTRMLLTTAVFAAVAALYACGANAMPLHEGGSGLTRVAKTTAMPPTIPDISLTGGSALARVAKTTAMPPTIPDISAAERPSWRGKGGKGEETGGAANPLQGTGVARRDNQLDPAIATAMASRTAKTAQASIGIAVKAAELNRPCSPQESRASC